MTLLMRRMLLVGALAGGLSAVGTGVAAASTATAAGTGATTAPATTAPAADPTAPAGTGASPTPPQTESEVARRRCLDASGRPFVAPPADPSAPPSPAALNPQDCLLPAGGVDTGAGGSAGTDDDEFGVAVPLAALGGVGALAGAGLVYRRLRADS